MITTVPRHEISLSMLPIVSTMRNTTIAIIGRTTYQCYPIFLDSTPLKMGPDKLSQNVDKKLQLLPA
jgi:hypothetical protein